MDLKDIVPKSVVWITVRGNERYRHAIVEVSGGKVVFAKINNNGVLNQKLRWWLPIEFVQQHGEYAGKLVAAYRKQKRLPVDSFEEVR